MLQYSSSGVRLNPDDPHRMQPKMRMGIDAKDDAEMMQGLSGHSSRLPCKPGFKIGRSASTVAFNFTLIRNANCVRVDNTLRAVMVLVIRDPTYCGMPSERLGAVGIRVYLLLRKSS